MRVVIACPTQINHRICVWMCALVYLYSLNFSWHCNVPHNRIQRTARNEKEAAEAAVCVTGVKTTSPMCINTAHRAYQAPYCYQLNCLPLYRITCTTLHRCLPCKANIPWTQKHTNISALKWDRKAIFWCGSLLFILSFVKTNLNRQLDVSTSTFMQCRLCEVLRCAVLRVCDLLSVLPSLE